MRNLFLASVVMLGFAGAAYAGEGNGEPFPGPSADVTTDVSHATMAHRDADPYQYRVGGGATSVTNSAIAHKDADPFQFRMAGQVIHTGAPTTGPQTGTATASTTHGLTGPGAPVQGTHG